MTRGRLACKRCIAQIRIDDIVVERQRNVKVLYPPAGSAKTLPGEEDGFDVINCGSTNSLSYEKEITKEITEFQESRATSKLARVTGWESSFQLEVGRLAGLGFSAKVGVKDFGSVTVETSEGRKFSTASQITVRRPLKLTVPPLTKYIVDYSVARKMLEIPAQIELVLEGEIVEDWIEYDPDTPQYDPISGRFVGRVLHRHKRHDKLSTVVRNEAQRTVAVDTLTTIRGSSREMIFRLREQKLTPGYEECAND